MKITVRIRKALETFYAGKRKGVLPFVLLNITLAILQALYIFFRYKYINEDIPFWFGKNWGNYQLAPRNYIYILPLISLGLTIAGGTIRYVNRLYLRYFDEILTYLVTASNLMLVYSTIFIIQRASLPYPPIIEDKYISLVLPAVISFLFVYAVLPSFIDLAHRKRLVTDPSIHAHPAMILREPTARGGGFVFAVVFLIVGVIFVGLHKQFLGVYLSVLMLAFLGLADDYQNTHPLSNFRILENPLLRLFLLFICVIPLIFSGMVVNSVSVPFNGLVQLDNFKLILGSFSVSVIPALLTMIWVVWLMNALSWSNGIDGQYAGVIGISSFFVAILALRFPNLTGVQKDVAILAAVSTGAAFGFTRYTWFPSKIMWGFGAMSAGLIIASLSIMVQTKVLVSVLFILVPFLDALVTFFRRLFQGKNPLAGDRGHLHHLLLDKGWSVQKIARFYWMTALIFGLVGLLSPEKYAVKLSLSIIGLVGFLIALLNLKSTGNKRPIQQPE